MLGYCRPEYDSFTLSILMNSYTTTLYRSGNSILRDTLLILQRIGSFETKVSLIWHNFQGYDSHPLMKVVSKFMADKLNCIPENIGKYKAMDVRQL